MAIPEWPEPNYQVSVFFYVAFFFNEMDIWIFFLQYLDKEDDVDTLDVVGVEILDDVDAEDDVDTELDVE